MTFCEISFFLQKEDLIPGIGRVLETAGTVRNGGEERAGPPRLIEQHLRTFQRAENHFCKPEI